MYFFLNEKACGTMDYISYLSVTSASLSPIRMLLYSPIFLKRSNGAETFFRYAGNYWQIWKEFKSEIVHSIIKCKSKFQENFSKAKAVLNTQFGNWFQYISWNKTFI